MKRFIHIAALPCALAITMLIVGCKSAGTSQNSATPKDFDATVRVSGLSCPQCANTITLIMDKDDAIASSTVDLGAGIVYIYFEKGRSLTAGEIISLVNDSGFTPGKVSFKDKGD